MAEDLELNPSEEVQIDELDDKDLEEASGGLAPKEESTNNGCNCSCS